jgi:hypothetical protein
MFTTNVWSKYIPIIRILLKKAKTADQTLELNIPDFERAGIARKSGYKFDVKFSKGKVSNVIIASPLASTLAADMLADETIKRIFTEGEYEISLNTKFQLSLKCLSRNEELEPANEAGNTNQDSI